MEWCCISRPNKERESYFKNISNRNLEVTLKQEINKKTRNCWFGTLYGTTTIGTGLATIFSGGSTSIIGTVPTTILAGVATYDIFNHMYESHQNIKSIEHILEKKERGRNCFCRQ